MKKTVYICSNCGNESPKWQGQCSSCKEWNTLEESQKVDPKKENKASSLGKKSGYAGGGSSSIINYDDISGGDNIRFDTGIGEFNRVLGGGLVESSVILLSGNPGIGKSTILIQVMAILSKKYKTLYVSGEESLQQIKNRGERLKIDGSSISFLSETNIERIVDTAFDFKPKIIVIDSIQTMYTNESQSSPGGSTQLKETTSHLNRYAKENGVTVILVGHVTKDGSLAGPKVLEHIIDASIMIEGETSSRYRIMRALKNRFGAVNEIGVFAMLETGLKEVTNPSKIFLTTERDSASGCVVFITKEGTRPILTEIQALMTETNSEYAKRVTLGLDNNRISIVLAILNKCLKVKIFNKDLYMNIVGGMKVNETASDLPVAMAIYSSTKNYIIPENVASFGEIGLTGEIRPVQNGEERIKEAIKCGMTEIIIPKGNKTKISNKNVKIIEIKHINELINIFSNYKKIE